MIIKQKNGTILEMTTKEFSELGHVLGSAVEAEAEVDGKTEVTTDFKVGDKVEVIGKSVTGRDAFIGNTTVITFIDEIGDIQIVEGNGPNGWYPPSSLKLIEEEPEEVLSYENVKEGEYFVVTDDDTNNHSHEFAIGEIVKAKSYTNSTVFKAERMDGSDWWLVFYTNVRRATAEEIAEATKPKFEIGDAISVNGRFALILSELDSEHEYKIKWYSDGGQTYTGKSYIRHATEEEKSHLQTLIGREKYEYKIGDLVELLSGSGSGYSGRNGYIFEVDGKSGAFIHLKDNGNKTKKSDTYTHPEKLKLITPVEWRHDFI